MNPFYFSTYRKNEFMSIGVLEGCFVASQLSLHSRSHWQFFLGNSTCSEDGGGIPLSKSREHRPEKRQVS